MLKDLWQEVGRLENIFLEILDDPTKKEVLLYPICYCQLVRKENCFEIDLDRLLGCANRTFHTFKGKWQDVLLELNLFQFITQTGDVLYGKDILRLSSPEGIKVSFLPEYREVFYEVYSRLLKYWTILSKTSSYSKRNTASEAVHLSAFIFNEQLFKEASLYCSLQALRFPYEGNFFSALMSLSDFYSSAFEGRGLDASYLKKTLKFLEGVPENYYGVNVSKLKRDVEDLLREVTKGGGYFVIKINSSMDKGHGKGLLRRIFSGIVRRIRSLGGKRWTLMNSGTDSFCSIETFWRRQRGLQIPA